MNKVNNIATLYPAYNWRGEITLAGVLRKYWPSISKKWKAKRTIEGNIADYEKRILESTDKLKGMCRYKRKDFDLLVNKLSFAGNYKDKTEEHYKYLIRLVIEACLEHGENIDVSLMQVSVGTSKKTKEGLVKSFTKEEDGKLLNWLKTLCPDTVTGAEIGVAIMYCLTVRNHEAAALKFTNHFWAEEYECWMINILWTMQGKTRKVKQKGKTSNAIRNIPCIYQELNNLISEREEWIKIKLEEENVDMIPICCSKHDYREHCTYEEINIEAKRVFNELGIKGNTWAEVTAGFEKEDFENFDQIMKEEKDLTAYVLRRNAATRYYGGMMLSEIELNYIMGHELGYPGVYRSDFINPELMEPLIDKIKRYYWEERI